MTCQNKLLDNMGNKEILNHLCSQLVHLAVCPGGLIDNMLTCKTRNTQKRLPFSEQGSDLSRSEIRVL